MAKESQKKKAQNSKNLKSFKKGQSGNLKGAPKGTRLSTILKGLMDVDFKTENKLTKKEETKTLAEWICHRLIITALAGKTKATDIIFDRTEGKVPNDVNIHTDSDDLESFKDQVRISNKSAKQDEKKS